MRIGWNWEVTSRIPCALAAGLRPQDVPLCHTSTRMCSWVAIL